MFEQQRAVTRTGLADPRLRLAVNLFGRPALNREEFAAREPSTTLGASLMVVAPFGKYDSDRLINLGSNRWAFKPEIGVLPTPRSLVPGTLCGRIGRAPGQAHGRHQGERCEPLEHTT